MNKQDLIDKINQVHYENINRGYEYLNRMWENDMMFITILIGLSITISLGLPLYLHSNTKDNFTKLEEKLENAINKSSGSNSP